MLIFQLRRRFCRILPNWIESCWKYLPLFVQRVLASRPLAARIRLIRWTKCLVTSVWRTVTWCRCRHPIPFTTARVCNVRPSPAQTWTVSCVTTTMFSSALFPQSPIPPLHPHLHSQQSSVIRPPQQKTRGSERAYQAASLPSNDQSWTLKALSLIHI